MKSTPNITDSQILVVKLARSGFLLAGIPILIIFNRYGKADPRNGALVQAMSEMSKGGHTTQDTSQQQQKRLFPISWNPGPNRSA